MASTYSQYKIELIGTGEEAGNWGNITNNNFGSDTPGTYQGFEQAIGGKATIDLSAGGTIALTLTNSNGAQNARALFFDLSGSPSGAVTLQVPAIQKSYIVKNGSGQTVTVEISGGTGVAVPNGSTTVVYADGTNVVTALNFVPSLTATTADINGGSIDGATLGTNSAITEADIDNININGNTISTTDTDGSLTLTPDGTGEVVTSKFMRGTFSDKVTAIGNTSTAATVDLSLGTVFTATLTGNCTFTFSNPNGVATTASSFTLILTNDATPSRSIVWPATVLYSDGAAPARTETANATDIWFFFTPDGGSTYYGSIPIKNAYI
jgi:hypothetical protein